MLDLWLPLAMGQRLVIAPSAVMKDFTSVRDLISQYQVVGITGVPSLLQVRPEIKLSEPAKLLNT